MVIATKSRVYGFGIGVLAAALAPSACGGRTGLGVGGGAGAGGNTTTGNGSSTGIGSSGGGGGAGGAATSGQAASSGTSSTTSSSSSGAPGSGTDAGEGSLSPATAVSAGSGHACALIAGGAVACWTDGSEMAAALVPGLTGGVTVVSMGGNSFGDSSLASFACAVTAGGVVECWGEVNSGYGPVPTPVTGLPSGVTSVSAGAGDGLSACAVPADGSVWCWGDNTFGQLGNGTSDTFSSVPVQITGFPSAVKAVSMGGHFACALTVSGGVWCWGENSEGQLGDGSATGSSAPVQVSGLASGVTVVSTAVEHACAVTAGGGVACWGAGAAGQNGDGMVTNAIVPKQVTGLTSGAATVSTTDTVSCAITAGGAVECWGNNTDGELGDGTTTSSAIPVPVEGLTNGVTSLSVGNGFVCAVTAGGDVSCWGGGSSTIPQPVSGLPQ